MFYSSTHKDGHLLHHSVFIISALLSHSRYITLYSETTNALTRLITTVQSSASKFNNFINSVTHGFPKMSLSHRFLPDVPACDDLSLAA